MNEKNEKILTRETSQNNQLFIENKIEKSTEDQPKIRALEHEVNRDVCAEEYIADSDVENESYLLLEDFPALNTKLGVFERLLNRVERLVIVLYHKIFDEVEAAMYLRLPDPENRGRETIRNYALRSKKLSYYKIGRNGLTFLKADLDLAMGRFKVQSFRDL